VAGVQGKQRLLLHESVRRAARISATRSTVLAPAPEARLHEGVSHDLEDVRVDIDDAAGDADAEAPEYFTVTSAVNEMQDQADRIDAFLETGACQQARSWCFC